MSIVVPVIEARMHGEARGEGINSARGYLHPGKGEGGCSKAV